MDEIRIVAAVICLVVFLWGWTLHWTVDPSADGSRKKLAWAGLLAIPSFLLAAGVVTFATMERELLLQEEINSQKVRVELRDKTSSMPGVAIDLFTFMSHPETGYLKDPVKLEEFGAFRISMSRLWTGPVPNHGRIPEIRMAVTELDTYMRGLGYKAQEGATHQLLALLSATDSTGQALVDLVTSLYKL